jgi:acetoacetate decarboxylase
MAATAAKADPCEIQSDQPLLASQSLPSGAHFIADLTPDLGGVVFDYLAKP